MNAFSPCQKLSSCRHGCKSTLLVLELVLLVRRDCAAGLWVAGGGACSVLPPSPDLVPRFRLNLDDLCTKRT